MYVYGEKEIKLFKIICNADTDQLFFYNALKHINHVIYLSNNLLLNIYLSNTDSVLFMNYFIHWVPRKNCNGKIGMLPYYFLKLK